MGEPVLDTDAQSRAPQSLELRAASRAILMDEAGKHLGKSQTKGMGQRLS